VPGDPNQTDRAARWALGEAGCVCIAMGRSKLGVLADEKGDPLFGGDYRFRYGEAVRVRSGKDGAIFALGAMTERAVKARDILREQHGLDVAVYCVSSPLAPDDDGAAGSGGHGAHSHLRGPLGEQRHGVHSRRRMTELGLSASFRAVGVHTYGESGSSPDVIAAMGLDEASLAKAFESLPGK
jgi:Transketolase, C-terminal subunit